MPIIIGFLGIALWMRIATIMEPVFGRKKWINLLADNTFSIMENQFLGFLLVKVAFGTIANGTKLFLKFDWSRCKSDIWWYYMPKDVEQTKILYLLAAIFVALLIQWILTQVKKMGKNIFLYVRQQLSVYCFKYFAKYNPAEKEMKTFSAGFYFILHRSESLSNFY